MSEDQVTNVPPTAPSATKMAAGKKGDKWWQTMLWGVVVAGAGIYLFVVFNNLEKNGGTVRMNWLFVELYKLLGKWGVLVVTLVIGGIGMVMGVRELIASRKATSA